MTDPLKLKLSDRAVQDALRLARGEHDAKIVNGQGVGDEARSSSGQEITSASLLVAKNRELI